jgi:hypothetical protein
MLVANLPTARATSVSYHCANVTTIHCASLNEPLRRIDSSRLKPQALIKAIREATSRRPGHWRASGNAERQECQCELSHNSPLSPNPRPGAQRSIRKTRISVSSAPTLDRI